MHIKLGVSPPNGKNLKIMKHSNDSKLISQGINKKLLFLPPHVERTECRRNYSRTNNCTRLADFCMTGSSSGLLHMMVFASRRDQLPIGKESLPVSTKHVYLDRYEAR